jgi:hypothetical protein
VAHLLWRGLEQGVGELGFCGELIVVSWLGIVRVNAGVSAWLWIVKMDAGVSAEMDLLGLV